MSKTQAADSRRRPRRRWWGAVILLLLIAAFVINSSDTLQVFFARATQSADHLPPVAPFKAGQRILILAPHPDDETLCCAGAIQAAQAAGAQPYLGWVTSGDGFELDAVLLDRAPRPSGTQLEGLGARRHDEALAAMRQLQVPKDHLSFLGYPDGGLLHLFLENYFTPYTSRYTRANKVPYPWTQTPDAPYSGQSLDRDLARLLDRVKPDLILAPSPDDAHPDHRAANYFITRLLGGRGEAGKLRYWIVHGGLEYPLPKGLHQTLPLLPSERGRGLAWQRLDLTPEQIQRKLNAIRAHRSQMNVMDRFLLAFVRKNELLTPRLLPDPAGQSAK